MSDTITFVDPPDYTDFTLIDSSGNANDGTYADGVVITHGVEGIVGDDTAVSFGPGGDGSSAGATAPVPTGLLSGGDCWACYWTTPGYTGSGGFTDHTSIGFQAATSPLSEVFILGDNWDDGGDTLGLDVSRMWGPNVPDVDGFTSATASVTPGVEHMLAVVYSAADDEYRCYVDGNRIDTVAGTGHPGATYDPDTLSFGNDSIDVATTFDEIAYGSGAPDDADIANLYSLRSDFVGYSAAVLALTPTGYYHLDETGFPDPTPTPTVVGSLGYRWEILVRNNDLSIAGQLAVIDLELHPKWQDIGTWAVDFDWDGDPVNAAAAALVQRGAGLVFRLNGKTVMSGPWMKPVKTRTGDQRSYSVGGVDDNQILVDHVAHPQPRSSAPPYLVNLQDVRGPAAAETVIKAYVNVNCGPGAVIARRIPGLTIEPDLVRGSSVKGLADWTKQLDALVQSLAQAGGVGYRTIQNDRPGLEFQIYLPADKTDTVVFGVEVGNLSGYSYGAQRPAANYIYALGSGEGTARTVREGQDEASVGAYGRIETVLDSSNTDDPLVLGQAITTELASKAEQFSVTITALDTRQHQWAPVAADPSTGYDLGDRVSVLIDGAQIIEQITELAITWNADSGTQVVPVVAAQIFGDQTQWVLGALVRTVKNQARQLRQQQGR